MTAAAVVMSPPWIFAAVVARPHVEGAADLAEVVGADGEVGSGGAAAENGERKGAEQTDCREGDQ